MGDSSASVDDSGVERNAAVTKDNEKQLRERDGDDDGGDGGPNCKKLKA